MGQGMEGKVVNPVVTVLMPVYDPPLEMLEKAIASMIGQTFENFEFLILDDGCRNEEVRAHLDKWATKDPRVRVSHEPHRGVPGTSNRGLAMARGEYIARQDSDDWSEPERLARQVSFLDRHPAAAVIGTDTYSHRADGTPLWRLRLPHSAEELAGAFWNGNPFVHGSTMFRRASALAVGGYREQLPCASDYDFLWRMTENGESANLDEVLYHYRYTSGSISARRAADQVKVYRAAQVLAAARRRGEPEEIPAVLEAAGRQMASDALRASLKQADHFMLAGDFSGACRAYLSLLRSNPRSALAWAKLFRLAVFAAVPPAREVCFR
jgi:glycosyltransferase involved in cell wall biosynthesis